jgi:hypothetical protein
MTYEWKIATPDLFLAVKPACQQSGKPTSNKAENLAFRNSDAVPNWRISQLTAGH